jgi:hypothetical protein
MNTMNNEKLSSKNDIGSTGVQIVAEELVRRGYNPTVMPNHNVGFDITVARTPAGGMPGKENLPSASTFEVEVKSSTSAGTQVPMQIRTHLECSVRNRVYVIVKKHLTGKSEFFIMTHEEVQRAWQQMPKTKPNGEPYLIRGTGYIDWRHIQPHQNRWDKFPA